MTPALVAVVRNTKNVVSTPVRNIAKTEGDNKISNGVNKQNNSLILPLIKDYGKAQLSSGFFGGSAARLPL